MSLQLRSLVLLLLAAVALTACGGDGHANHPPTARLRIEPTEGVTPLLVTLDGSTSDDRHGRIVSYVWDCGDGSPYESGAVSQHIFVRPGAFTVKLTVTDNKGVTAFASQRVDVVNRPPVASFSPYHESSFVAAVMRFDAAASVDPDGRITSYAWDFGDGSAGSGVIAEHRYAVVGEYVVRLRVTDDFAASGETQSSVDVRSESEFPTFHMLDLGTLGGADSEGRAINAAGQVTGLARTADSVHAFRATAGQPMVDLGTLGGSGSGGYAINDAGVVTGGATTSDAGFHPFVARPGEPMIDLGTLPGSANAHGTAINSGDRVAGTTETGPGQLFTRAFVVSPGQPMIELGTHGTLAPWPHTINDAGQVAFSAIALDGHHYHAFLYGPDRPPLDLGTLGGDSSYAYAINSSGQVAGSSQFLAGSSTTHAFVAGAGQGMVDLGALADGPGMSSQGVAINAAGQVTGLSNLWGAPYHAFLASAGRPMVDLGTLEGGTYSMGLAINSAGVVAGGADTADGQPHAFVVMEGRPMIDLGTLGGAQSVVHDMNDAGQVTGSAETADGNTHAFLASPITVLFSKLAESTAAIPPASHLVPVLSSAQDAYEDRDLPTSCDGLGDYDVAVTNLAPGQVPQADVDALLEQSEAIAEILECR